MSGGHDSHSGALDLTLHVWRQRTTEDEGRFETYSLHGISEHCSFLEMLDQLNEQLLREGREPVAFDHDCREGICGSCGVVINGQAHGPDRETATCQLHMRRFKSGDTLYVEPFRAKGFPILRDLVVDRSAFDRIVSVGGFVSVNTGSAPDANAVAVSKPDSDLSMDAAQCIGCGACVAACPNAAAMLFVGAKVAHLALLPQGKVDKEGFGNCGNIYECEAACPKSISVDNIARLNREYLTASMTVRPSTDGAGSA
jgi:succinate dehydrogenase / fumarate reductase iron-sulfur subunit